MLNRQQAIAVKTELEATFPLGRGYEVYIRGDAWRGYYVNVYDQRTYCTVGGFGLAEYDQGVLADLVRHGRANYVVSGRG